MAVDSVVGAKFALNGSAMKQHILIVDDEDQIRELLSLYLTRHGYEVSTARTSAQTLQIIEKTLVNIVVLDISLADEDGMGLLSAIKARHPEVRWRDIAGFRNVAAHDYQTIDLKRVWEVVDVHLPQLRSVVDDELRGI